MRHYHPVWYSGRSGSGGDFSAARVFDQGRDEQRAGQRRAGIFRLLWLFRREWRLRRWRRLVTPKGDIRDRPC